MPDNDTTIQNTLPLFQPTVQLIKETPLVFSQTKFLPNSILCKNPMSIKNFQLSEKEIGNHLKEGYICKPDALRVYNPVKEIPPVISKTDNVKTEVKVPQVATTYASNYDITKTKFDGSAEDLNRCLKGTKLEGQGQVFLEAQEKYGINAIFLMAIVEKESSSGEAPARERTGKIHKYNVAGLTTGSKVPGKRFQDFDSYKACIDSLCRNLHKHYISKNHTTISSIQKIYAPGNSRWTNAIRENMAQVSKNILAPYKNNLYEKKLDTKS